MSLAAVITAFLALRDLALVAVEGTDWVVLIVTAIVGTGAGGLGATFVGLRKTKVDEKALEAPMRAVAADEVKVAQAVLVETIEVMGRERDDDRQQMASMAEELRVIRVSAQSCERRWDMHTRVCPMLKEDR